MAIERSLKAGATGVRVSIDSGFHDTYSYSQGQLELLKRAESRIITLDLFIGGKSGSLSSNNLKPESINALVEEGVRTTALLMEDNCNSLPDPELCYKGGGAPLLQRDISIESITPDEKLDLARGCYEEIATADRRLIYAKSTYENTEEYGYMADSQGFNGEMEKTDFGICMDCRVNAEDGTYTEGFYGAYSLFRKDLKWRGCASKALEDAIQKIGARPGKRGVMNVVFANTSSSRIVAEMLSALDGSLIQQRRSFLCDSLDKRIFPESLSIMDNPHLPGMSGSRYFDSEGLATKPGHIIERGVVKTYFLNTYFANKLKSRATTEAPSAPSIDYAALEPRYRELTFEQLLAAVDRGLVVTNFLGGHCNPATGDFSYGVEGYLIEGGRRGAPICGMNITGNMMTLWNNYLFASHDTIEGLNWQIPSIAFENVTVI